VQSVLFNLQDKGLYKTFGKTNANKMRDIIKVIEEKVNIMKMDLAKLKNDTVYANYVGHYKKYLVDYYNIVEIVQIMMDEYIKFMSNCISRLKNNNVDTYILNIIRDERINNNLKCKQISGNIFSLYGSQLLSRALLHNTLFSKIEWSSDDDRQMLNISSGHNMKMFVSENITKMKNSLNKINNLILP
jgi:hypothetical protein